MNLAQLLSVDEDGKPMSYLGSRPAPCPPMGVVARKDGVMLFGADALNVDGLHIRTAQDGPTAAVRRYIAEHPGCTRTQIVQGAGEDVTASELAPILGNLVRNGFARVELNDFGGKHYWLTDKGVQAL